MVFATISACRTSSPRRRPGDFKVHIVQKGENVSRIAKKYGLQVSTIAQANGLLDASKLAIGQRLVIPPRGAARPAMHPADKDPDPPVIKEPLPPRPKPPPKRPAPATKYARSPDIGKSPLIWPVDGVVVSSFGPREGGRHAGVDIGAPEGAVIWSSAAGQVVFAGTRDGYGKMVIVAHENGLVTIYAHNALNLVEDGKKVKQGDPVALVGTGSGAFSPGLHFEIREGRKPVDPLKRLP